VRRVSSAIVRRPPFGSNPLVGERGSDTQRRILEAALEVFGKVGFAEARVELITEQAGCSRPAFYQYFSSKDDVFWTLAGELAKQMIGLAKRLERVTPDEAGVDHLTGWIGQFMDLHEAWAPVFASFQAAMRDDEPGARDAEAVSDRTGQALLRAFGVRADARNRRLVQSVVAILIRCSFFAEQAPGGLDRQPLVRGLAVVVHRIFEGPIDGVNVLRSEPGRRRGAAIALPEVALDGRDWRARGAQTRQRLLDAGAKVLPARGYHDARVDDIVATAGVSHGTFYRYFANKDDFFRVLAQAASVRMIELLDRLDLEAAPEALRAWLDDYFAAYEADGGVISTWQEMQTNAELAEFSRQVAASVFTRLVRLLDRRAFGVAVVDAVTLLALIERAPYSVYTLGFMSRDDAIESTITIIRRGLLALDD
jgi:AcrR family transcriptional regulator